MYSLNGNMIGDSLHAP